MISSKDAADYFGVTLPRLRQIIFDEMALPVIRDSKQHIQIPSETMRTISKARGIQVPHKVVTIGIEKGGTGKTLTTLNTALSAARVGIRTLVCDFDPECCASIYLAPKDMDWDDYDSALEVFSQDLQIASCIKSSRFDGVDFLPAKAIMRKLDRDLMDANPKTLLRKKMQGLHDMYDLILFDLPPSFTKLCASAYLTSDLVICPVNHDFFSVQSMRLTIEDIEEACQEYEVKMPSIFVLKNRFGDENSNIASRDISVELNREFPELLLPFQIKASASLTNCLNNGLSIYDCPKEKGIEAVRGSFQELLGLIFPRKRANSKDEAEAL